MATTLKFVRKWKASYEVLRWRNGFAFVASVRYGFWLAQS